jgi:lysophospholipase L1-like esterase
MNRRLLIVWIGLPLLVAALFSPAAAKSPNRHHKMPVYYLSLGTSLAAGVQADESGASVVTDVSYPGLLADIIREDIRKLRHVNLGCPGENSDTFIDGGICDYRRGSQLDEAVHFLHTHGKFTGLITIDLGANDVLSCVQGTEIDLTCIGETIERLSVNLSYVLATLREAAGPNVPIIGMNYYNPMLTFWFTDQNTAALTVILQDQINAALENVYAQFSIPVADVAGAFWAGDLGFDSDVNGLPDSLDNICAWTWMCTYNNIHPNEYGYQVIADEFAAILPPLIPAQAIHHACKPQHR